MLLISSKLCNSCKIKQEQELKAKEAEQRAQADADRDSFNLTGSDRKADVEAANGQQDLLASNPELKEPEIRKISKETDKGIALFSRSPMKSVEANIKRGQKSLEKALEEKTSVHRAMFRNGLGWVDFVWGDQHKGIAHILYARKSKDELSESQAIQLIHENLIPTIALGREIRRDDLNGNTRLVISHDNHEAVLVKKPSSNSWLLTGFKLKSDSEVRGATQSSDTQSRPIRSRSGLGADFGSMNQNLKNGNSDSETPLFSRKNKNSWYYSPLERGIESAPDRIFTKAPQVKLWLASNAAKMGVKAEEIQWSGVNDWLDLKGKDNVSKQDILDYLKEGGVQLKEVTLGAGEIYDENNYEKLPNDIRNLVNDADSGKINEEDFSNMAHDLGYKVNYDMDGFVENITKLSEDSLDPTQYEKYTLPNGENYKEMLLTLPTKVLSQEEARAILNAPADKELNQFDIHYASNQKAGVYKSSHWDQKNVLAHIRMNDRTDAEGNKVLFIEEIQSDWHQAGRKQGYNHGRILPDTTGWTAELLEHGWTVRNAEGKSLDTEMPARDAAHAIEKTARVESIAPKTNGVPDAPFKDTKAWTSLALKRIISYAAEHGYDKVAFVNGEQSADRYDLSKQLDKVVVRRYHDGWVVEGYNGKTETLNHTAENDSDLSDAIGKELAEKAIKDNGGTYEGLDLKVGGEGMKDYYNKILPQVANDVLKKVGGGKLELTDIPSIDDPSNYMNRRTEYFGAEPSKADIQKVLIATHSFGPDSRINPITGEKIDLKLKLRDC